MKRYGLYYVVRDDRTPKVSDAGDWITRSVFIFEADREPLADIIRRAETDPDNWGEKRHADRVASECSRMIASGFTHSLRDYGMGRRNFTAKYLETDGGNWCQPTVDLGRYLDRISLNITLARRIMGKDYTSPQWHKIQDSPDALIEESKATRCVFDEKTGFYVL